MKMTSAPPQSSLAEPKASIPASSSPAVSLPGPGLSWGENAGVPMDPSASFESA
jgi:hypothetical protein